MITEILLGNWRVFYMAKSLSIVGFGNNRAQADYYPTPPSAVESLFKRVKFDGEIWECASGNGAMSKIIEKYNTCFSSDIRTENIYGIGGIDFLMSKRKTANIVTNPPYILAKEFVERALLLSEQKVAMFLKLVFLESSDRYELFNHSPLKTVFVFCKRQKIYANGVIGKNSGLIAYAWFLWDKNYIGKPYIEWIKE